MTNRLRFGVARFFVVPVFGLLSASLVVGQDLPEPTPGPAKNVSVPQVREFSLPNGLRVVVVKRGGSPLVSVQLVMAAGASQERSEQAGLAGLSAELLTKGTAKRSASEIAAAVEYLGGSLNSSASWSSAALQLSVTSDKIDEAFGIFSESVVQPSFPQAEVDLLKAQTLDGLAYNLSQPGFVANYAASAYSFGEHPTGGTLKSIEAINRDAIVDYAKRFFVPNRATLIFVGDITEQKARLLVGRHLSKWRKGPSMPSDGAAPIGLAIRVKQDGSTVRRILVVDLPNTGQASVSFHKRISEGRLEDPFSGGRVRKANPDFFAASVLNSVFGGGYSSRLNQEIRIKRGLSYGAGSSFAWRTATANFSTRTQTKNESAAEVVALIVEEIVKLRTADVSSAELGPRKAVLTGSFGQSLETNRDVAAQLAALYPLGLEAAELNAFIPGINTVPASAVKDAATRFFSGFDVIVVGDNSVFGAELKKRFPNTPMTVVKASELDVSGLR